MLKDAKISSVSSLIIECDRDVKKLYRVIYNMTGKHSINPLPSSHSDKKLADNFANFLSIKLET